MYYILNPQGPEKEIIEMKKTIMAAVLLCGAILLSGCTHDGRLKRQGKYRLLIGSSMFESFYDEDFGEMTVDGFGRLYTKYGSTHETIPESAINQCSGYLDNNENRRVFYLADDPDRNYLMVVNFNSINGDWCFYRAQDTVNKDILTPDFVKPDGYECWGSSGVHYSDKKEPAKIALKINCDDIKYVNCYVAVNHKFTLCSTAKLPSGKLIKKGDFVYMEIKEDQVRDRIPEDEPFNIEVKFKVVDANGDEQDVYGSFSHDVMLGSYLYSLEINKEVTYYLNNCI